MKTPSTTDRRNMTAADLFEGDLIQVFSKKNGEWLGTVRQGETIAEKEQDLETKKEQDPNQLGLF